MEIDDGDHSQATAANFCCCTADLICSLVAVANHCQQYYRTTEIFGGDRRRGNEQMDQTKCSLAAAISTVLLNEN